jgi:hypothetical protein
VGGLKKATFTFPLKYIDFYSFIHETICKDGMEVESGGDITA